MNTLAARTSVHPSLSTQLVGLFKLIRVHQWTKNGLILFPLVFSGNLRNTEAVIPAILCTLLFCLLASSVYILNDTLDVRGDRQHPHKRKRPLASGAVSFPLVLVAFILLLSLSFLGAFFFLNNTVAWLFMGYFVTNCCYSLFLKFQPPIDIIIVALFYLIRPVVGAFAIGVIVSNWLVITTFFAALYLVSLKRLSELDKQKNGTFVSRRNLDHYSASMLGIQSTISLTLALVCYTLYASTFPHYFVLTIIPLTGLALRVTMLKETRLTIFEIPEKVLLTDRISLVFAASWVLAVFLYHWRY